MATQQAYNLYAQNKGTLAPGQFISVNNHTVQVERYLSQGGFAHVYLVRTEKPIHNTTHHVLKRIAASNDAMVVEVKKEVDIMKQLQGHPNIVRLIDASWQRMSNGLYEVFILMEFCAGGGIIDMMNRRLRERLTEAEILQIFVDVCEGVAAMHSKHPALIHRDLKVENILQSSPTSFKLCDFGSATRAATRPPATTQEIRTLEADLNRHTTMQYRAPEMVDSYLRRPVDEKSDVWALGVLLYKLCYYTTPFEEHGPLAILNVQYRFPPYPVYSGQMTSMIASMLREHGAQRPSVFELLSNVHGLRGTKSLFQYAIPSPQPLSPRHIQSHSQFQAQVKVQSQSPRQPLSNSTSLADSNLSKSLNVGIQAREKVLEAIAPMRRRRPSLPKDVRSSSPQKAPDLGQVRGKNAEKGASTNWLDGEFHTEDDEAWRAVLSKSIKDSPNTNDAWKLKETDKRSRRGGQEPSIDFAAKLWDSFDPSTRPNAAIANHPKATTTPPRPSESAVIESSPRIITPNMKSRNKDAFGDLGLGLESRPPPTLGEARKFRTGLAAMSTVTQNGYSSTHNNETSTSIRPTPSPRPSRLSPPKTPTSSQSQSHPAVSNNSGPLWKPPSQLRPSSRAQLDSLSAETRFPSLDVLDASFPAAPLPKSSSQPQIKSPQSILQPTRVELSNDGLRPNTHSRVHDGVRSQQVTGVAMRDLNKRAGELPSDEVSSLKPSRPILVRKHRSSLSIKPKPQTSAIDHSDAELVRHPDLGPSSFGSPRFRPSPSLLLEAREWTAGIDKNAVSPTLASAGSSSSASASSDLPVLRGSPGKRASLLESNLSIPLPQEAISVSRSDGPPVSQAHTFSNVTSTAHSKSSSTIPAIAKTVSPPSTVNIAILNDRPPERKSELSRENDSSSDEEPESAMGYIPPTSQLRKQEQTPKRTGKGRQSSVHDLVDLWGGAAGAVSKEFSAKVEVDTPARNQQSTTTSLSSSSHVTPQMVLGSSQAMLSPPTDSHLGSRSPKQASPASDRHNEQPSTAGSTQSSASARSRPQSMFIFPVSKVNSESTPLSAGIPNGPTYPSLSPVEDSRPRAGVRRTSISDMVQHYESIGGNAKPLSPMLKPPASKTSQRQVDNNRYSRGQSGNMPAISRRNDSTHTSVKAGLSVPNNSFADDSETRTSPDARTPHPTLFRTSQIGQVGPERSTANENPMQPSRLPPHKRSATTDASSLESTKFPSRKSTTSEESAIADDGRSPSPERPYQGVGKLIDQWQRKTAEAEAPRSPTKGPRRTRLVSGANRGR